MENLMTIRPTADEFGGGFAAYIKRVPDGAIDAILEHQLDEIKRVLQGLSDSEALMKHAPYTWTIKEVLGHVIDAERVFGYRAMRIARHDATPLPGFDEN